jgi:hypothetical protein
MWLLWRKLLNESIVPCVNRYLRKRPARATVIGVKSGNRPIPRTAEAEEPMNPLRYRRPGASLTLGVAAVLIGTALAATALVAAAPPVSAHPRFGPPAQVGAAPHPGATQPAPIALGNTPDTVLSPRPLPKLHLPELRLRNLKRFVPGDTLGFLGVHPIAANLPPGPTGKPHRFDTDAVGGGLLDNSRTAAPGPAMISAVGRFLGWRLPRPDLNRGGRTTAFSAGSRLAGYTAGVSVRLPVSFARREVGR